MANNATLSTCTAAEEAEIIRQAQGGDAAALERLFEMYTPKINAAAASFAHRLGYDDARQAAALGFIAAVHAFDASRPSGATRLSVLLNRYLVVEMWDAVRDNGMLQIPTRSLKRYFQILRVAGGDLSAAQALAPKHDMRAATFAMISVAVTPGLSYDAEALERAAPGRYAAVEDQVLSAAALAACSPDERSVLELHYGIGEYETTPLSEVAVQLGFSLALTRRLHAAGLAAAREALGAL